MIINVRGTSGSGKTTLVRKVMDLYPGKFKIYTKDRKRPLGYLLTRPGGRSLFLVGHYETDCGGCDTITSINKVYEVVEEAAAAGHDVLYEGLLISAEYNRTAMMDGLYKDEGHLVIALDTTLEESLASVNARRANALARRTAATEAYNASREAEALAKGRKPPKPRPLPRDRGEVAEKNTKSKWKAVQAIMKKFEATNVRAEWHSRDSAFDRIKEVLGHGA